MPSFNLYKQMFGGRTLGQVRKDDSDMVMEASWDGDISSCVAYFYSKVHDSEFDSGDDLHPCGTRKVPVEIKFFEIEYNSLSKDEVPYHIMFKPSFDYKELIPFYDEEFARPYGALFPDGLFCDIPDKNGVYHRWLCAGQYRRYSEQFSTFFVLPCTHKLQWVYKRQKYECWCVLKNQSSYNSGEWAGRNIRIAENQKVIWLPFTPETANIFYDMRMCISEPREEPLTWHISKVEDMNTKGVLMLTAAQDRFNAQTDFIEKDDEGKAIGMWASFFDINETPADDPVPKQPSVFSKITYSGSAAEVKVNGNYKKFTVTFYDDAGEVPFRTGGWFYTVDGVDASELLDVKDSSDDSGIKQNQVRVKFVGGDSYIGKNLVVSFKDDTGVKSSQLMNIVGV